MELKPSLYVSTRGGIQPVDFEAAVMMGLADDGGLLVPAMIPHYDADELDQWRELTYPQLAFQVMKPFVGDAFTDQELKELIDKSYATLTRRRSSQSGQWETADSSSQNSTTDQHSHSRMSHSSSSETSSKKS